jgi:hypothetical protein
MIKAPEAASDAENDNNPAYNYIKNDWNELCNLLASTSFPENGYRDLIDINSFVDYIMVNEIVYNRELFWPKSVFSYKSTHNHKICLGPLWDFDWAFGYAGGGHSYFTNSSASLHAEKHSFFLRFFEDPVFVARYKKRWEEKYAAIGNVSNFINEMSEKLESAVMEDTKRWKITGGYQSSYPVSYEAEIAKMTTWWNNRITWLNSEIEKLPANISNVLPEKQLKAWIENGQLYVTGLTIGKDWRIYNSLGAIVFHRRANSADATTILPSKGMYIIHCDENTTKIVFF